MKFAQDTLYVTDLDGTLLGPDAKVPQDAVRMLNEMIDAGLHFTVATARSWVSAQPLIDEMRLKHPVVAYNGAYIVDPASGASIDRCLFTAEQAAQVAKILTENGRPPMIYAEIDGAQKVTWLKSTQSAGITDYAQSRAGDPRLNPVDSAEAMYLGDVFYASVLDTFDALQPMVAPLRELDFVHVNLMSDSYDPEMFWLEVSHRDATKATGVERLKQLTGKEKLVCFGDNLNDLAMFSVADECYAVDNAKPELKAAATGVIEANTDLGVPKFLRTCTLR